MQVHLDKTNIQNARTLKYGRTMDYLLILNMFQFRTTAVDGHSGDESVCSNELDIRCTHSNRHFDSVGVRRLTETRIFVWSGDSR